MECSKEEVRAWKEEARGQKAEAARLNCRVRRFSGAFHAVERCTNRGVRRFDGRVSRAVGKAVEAEKVSANILEIKDEHGVIKDWAREAMADLTGIEDVPANSSFRIFKKCATQAGMEVRGSWDRRSVPRVMHEVTQAAEVLIVERFLESMGLLSTSWLQWEIGELTFLHRAVSQWRRCFPQQYTVLLQTHHDRPRRHRPPSKGFVHRSPPRTESHHHHPV